MALFLHITLLTILQRLCQTGCDSIDNLTPLRYHQQTTSDATVTFGELMLPQSHIQSDQETIDKSLTITYARTYVSPWSSHDGLPGPSLIAPYNAHIKQTPRTAKHCGGGRQCRHFNSKSSNISSINNSAGVTYIRSSIDSSSAGLSRSPSIQNRAISSLSRDPLGSKLYEEEARKERQEQVSSNLDIPNETRLITKRFKKLAVVASVLTSTTGGERGAGVQGRIEDVADEEPTKNISETSAPSAFRGVSQASQRRLDLLAKHDLRTAILEVVEIALSLAAKSTDGRDGHVPRDLGKGAGKRTWQNDRASPCSIHIHHNNLAKILQLDELFAAQTTKAIHTANLLNNLLRVEESQHAVAEYFYANLARSLIDSDPLIRGAGVIFDPGRPTPARTSTANDPSLVQYTTPYLYRSTGTGTIRARDIAKESRGRYALNGTDGYEWYWKQRKVYSPLLWWYRNVCDAAAAAIRPGTTSGPSGREVARDPAQVIADLQTAISTTQHGLWSDPRYDCTDGAKPGWTVTYSVPFFGCNSQKNLAFKGVVRLDIDLSQVDIDQCGAEGGKQKRPFASTHKCRPTTNCVPVRGYGFRRGAYRCQCLTGYYHHGYTQSSVSFLNKTGGLTETDSDMSTPTIGSTRNRDDVKNVTASFVTRFSFDGSVLETNFVRRFLNESRDAEEKEEFGENNESDSDEEKEVGEDEREDKIELKVDRSMRLVEDFSCIRCSRGCSDCVDESQCLTTSSPSSASSHDAVLRSLLISIQLLSIIVTMVLICIIVTLRRRSNMTANFWCLLEIHAVGVIVLHISVSLLYFEASSVTCLLIPWLRELGFAVAYGSLVLRIYKVLMEYRSQTKKHGRRVLPVRNRDLYRHLSSVIFILIAYMVSWSAVILDDQSPEEMTLTSGSSRIEAGVDMMEVVGKGEGGGKEVAVEVVNGFTVCQSLWCEYVIEAAETVMLGFGLFLCRGARQALSNRRQVHYISIALYNEALLSRIFYLTRHFVWTSIHPDYVFLIYVIRNQLTVTVAMLIVLIPKICYSFSRHTFTDDASRGRAYSTSDSTALPPLGDIEGGAATRDRRTSALSTLKQHPSSQHSQSSPCALLHQAFALASSTGGEVNLDDVNLSDMNPDDLRYELKRLYTQLQVYKTKTMRLDNPHISKRHGGRKQTHRRFSLQAFHTKHSQRGTFSSGGLGSSSARTIGSSRSRFRSGAGGSRTDLGGGLKREGMSSSAVPSSAGANSEELSRSMSPEESSNSTAAPPINGASSSVPHGAEGTTHAVLVSSPSRLMSMRTSPAAPGGVADEGADDGGVYCPE